MSINQSVIDILLTQSLGAKKEGEYVWKNELFFKLLSDPNDYVRFAAANELQSRVIKKSELTLIENLSTHKNPKIRESCANALGQICINNKQFITNLQGILAKLSCDHSPSVRARAVLSIGMMFQAQAGKGSRRLLSVIYNTAKDKNIDVRVCTASILCKVPHNAKSKSILNSLLSDKNREVKEWASLSASLIAANKLKMSPHQQEKLETEIINKKILDFDEILKIARNSEEQ